MSVAPDGSPVDIYLALPGHDEVARLRSVIAPGTSILDLGSGPGRIANPLAAAGHTVVAVDNSADMLRHVVGAETVLADVWTLDLGRRFDVVLALGHLINDRSMSRRLQLLHVCHRHLADDGLVVVQRYPPDWAPVENQQRQVGEVGTRLFDVHEIEDGQYSAAIEYTLGPRSWTQRYEVALVDDDELASLAGEAGLRVEGTLGEGVLWVTLRRL